MTLQACSAHHIDDRGVAEGAGKTHSRTDLANRRSGHGIQERLDSLLVTNQMSAYCQQINQFTGQSFAKIFLMQSLNAAGGS